MRVLIPVKMEINETVFIKLKYKYTKIRPEKKFHVSAIVCVLGIVLKILGVAYSWNLVLALPGFFIFGGEIRFLIHYLYKIFTGKDTPSMRFWTWVLNK